MVASLGMGVGVNMTLYAVVKRAVFRDSQAIREPERVITVTPGLSYPDFVDVNGQSTVAGYAIFQSASLLWARESGTRTLGAKIVSADYFEVLGVRPVLGRTFASNPQDPDQLLVSHQFWQRYLGSDIGIVGHPMTINGWRMTIIGVLPADFYSAVAPLLAPAIYVPISSHVNVALDVRGAAQFDVVARLRPGTTFAQGATELRALDARLRQAYPDVKRGQPLAAFPRLSPFQASGDAGPRFALFALLMLIAALGGLVLLIACANVAGVLAARADERRRELAIRAAIGANRNQLMVELFAEGLLLGAISVAGAIAVWRLGVVLLPRIPAIADLGATVMPPPLPLGFSISLTLVVAAACTIAPVLLAKHIRPIDDLRPTPGMGIPGRLRVPRILVGVQVAISAVFVASAVFVVRTTVMLDQVTPGLDLSHNVVISVRLPSTLGETATLDLERELRRVEGLTDVTYGALPTAFSPGRNRLRLDASGQAGLQADVLQVEPGFLTTLGLPIVRGRGLEHADVNPGGQVRPAIVDRTFVDRYAQGRDPIGMTMTLAPDTESGQREQRLLIVGVSAAANLAGPLGVPTPLVFAPSEAPIRSATLLVRTRGPAAAAVPSIIRTLGSRFAGASASVTPLADQFNATLAPLRVAIAILGVLALIGVVVAMVGLHGLVSYQTSRRTFDIGVRRALGATTSAVIGLILRDAASMVAGGVLVGVLLAAAASRLLPPIAGHYALGPIDLASAVGVLALTTLIACLRPARIASKVEPTVALRAE
jgi:predicted permease